MDSVCFLLKLIAISERRFKTIHRFPGCLAVWKEGPLESTSTNLPTFSEALATTLKPEKEVILDRKRSLSLWRKVPHVLVFVSVAKGAVHKDRNAARFSSDGEAFGR